MHTLVITNLPTDENVRNLVPIKAVGTYRMSGNKLHEYEDEEGIYTFVRNEPEHYSGYRVDAVIIDPALKMSEESKKFLTNYLLKVEIRCDS